MTFVSDYEAPGLGGLTLASEDGRALCGLYLAGQKHYLGSTEGPYEERGDLPAFAAARAWLDRYLAGERPLPTELALAPRGTEFRQLVWQLLREVPYGEVVTYGELARRVGERSGRQTSARAVGGAVGRNPISLVVPCHRVVGADGSLTGYAGGIERKVWLLAHEGVEVDGLRRPVRGTAL